jgi:flagellar biosynthesis protein FlhF
LLARLGDRRLVLVDTAAAAPRGPAAEATSEALSALRGIAEIVVTLPATTQASTLRTAATRYAQLGASACIATRLDEATTLGGLVSAMVEAGLPLAYVADGTRIPDDLRPARAEDVVSLAVALAERHGATADEELLARRLGGRVHAAG